MRRPIPGTRLVGQPLQGAEHGSDFKHSALAADSDDCVVRGAQKGAGHQLAIRLVAPLSPKTYAASWTPRSAHPQRRSLSRTPPPARGHRCCSSVSGCGHMSNLCASNEWCKGQSQHSRAQHCTYADAEDDVNAVNNGDGDADGKLRNQTHNRRRVQHHHHHHQHTIIVSNDIVTIIISNNTTAANLILSIDTKVKRRRQSQHKHQRRHH